MNDVFGWFSPSTIKAKILLQKASKERVGWDDPVPSSIYDAWFQWSTELPHLSEHISRCYFNEESQITLMELHGFCDAFELTHAAIIYLQLIITQDNQVSLVISKTKAPPIKRLTIPHLELCGACLLAQLHHVRQVLDIPLFQTFAWTDSTIVLAWLDGSPRWFETFVGNRVATIMEFLPPKDGIM